MMPLVAVGPEVKFCHSMAYVAPSYLPVFGRYLSSSLSCLITAPAVTVLVVVSCVPMPKDIVSALAPEIKDTARAETARTLEDIRMYISCLHKRLLYFRPLPLVQTMCQRWQL